MISLSKKRQWFYILILLLVGAHLLCAQSTTHFPNYTIEDGLVSDAVYDVMQDRDGYIWISTEKGISKFDGYTFKNFQEDLPNLDVWDLTEDSKGRIWVHTIDNRLVYIYQDSIHEVYSKGNHEFYIWQLYEDNGKIWFLSKNTTCLLYTSPSPRDATLSRMPSSA